MGGEGKRGEEKGGEEKGEEGDGCLLQIPKYAIVPCDDRGLVPWNISAELDVIIGYW